MTPTITAFERSPDRGRGLARDFRLRWALEEVGQTYDLRLMSFEALKQPAHRALNPFGQIPTYQDGSVTLFESGAILLHLADQHPGLLPTDPAARARAVAWIFAALATVELPIVDLSMATMLESDKPWAAERRPLLVARIHTRLTDLAQALGPADWLGDAFCVSDLLMITVLRRLQSSALLDDHPSLLAYIARGEARPAFQRAFASQQAVPAPQTPPA